MSTSLAGYRFEDANGYSIVSLLPSLNDAPWGEIEKCGNQVVERVNGLHEPTFLVDLTSMDYMGSSIVALVIRIWKAIDERDGRMVVLNDSSIVEEVLNLAGLTRIWTVVSSREDGEQALGISDRKPSNVMASLLIVLGLIALAAAGTGLYLLMYPIDQFEADDVLVIEFGCSAVAFISGLYLIVRNPGAARAIGVVLLLASLGISVTGFVLRLQ